MGATKERECTMVSIPNENRSDIKTIVVSRSGADLDRACLIAYRSALAKFGANKEGHFGENYIDKFPRSESSLIVEFDSMKVVVDIIGVKYKYVFNAYLERTEEK